MWGEKNGLFPGVSQQQRLSGPVNSTTYLQQPPVQNGNFGSLPMETSRHQSGYRNQKTEMGQVLGKDDLTGLFPQQFPSQQSYFPPGPSASGRHQPVYVPKLQPPSRGWTSRLADPKSADVQSGTPLLPNGFPSGIADGPFKKEQSLQRMAEAVKQSATVGASRSTLEKSHVDAKTSKLVPIAKAGRGPASQPGQRTYYNYETGIHTPIPNGFDASKADAAGSTTMLKLPAIVPRKAAPGAKLDAHITLGAKPATSAVSTPARIAKLEVKGAGDSLQLGVTQLAQQKQVAGGKAPETPSSAKRGASNRTDFFNSLKKKELGNGVQTHSEPFDSAIRTQSSLESPLSMPTSPLSASVPSASAGLATAVVSNPPSIVTSAVQYESSSTSRLSAWVGVRLEGNPGAAPPLDELPINNVAAMLFSTEATSARQASEFSTPTPAARTETAVEASSKSSTKQGQEVVLPDATDLKDFGFSTEDDFTSVPKFSPAPTSDMARAVTAPPFVPKSRQQPSTSIQGPVSPPNAFHQQSALPHVPSPMTNWPAMAQYQWNRT
eukprot:jgi/Botrbrau1/14918/Bobra.0018s0022.1